MTNVDRQRVRELIAQASGAGRDDAWHALVELGAAAIPELAKVFDEETDVATRVTIMAVAAQQPLAEAIVLLEQGLRCGPDEIWKTALDGLVSVGGAEGSRAIIRARDTASPEKRAWLDEAAAQLTDGTAQNESE